MNSAPSPAGSTDASDEASSGAAHIGDMAMVPLRRMLVDLGVSPEVSSVDWGAAQLAQQVQRAGNKADDAAAALGVSASHGSLPAVAAIEAAAAGAQAAMAAGRPVAVAHRRVLQQLSDLEETTRMSKLGAFLSWRRQLSAGLAQVLRKNVATAKAQVELVRVRETEAEDRLAAARAELEGLRRDAIERRAAARAAEAAAATREALGLASERKEEAESRARAAIGAERGCLARLATAEGRAHEMESVLERARSSDAPLPQGTDPSAPPSEDDVREAREATRKHAALLALQPWALKQTGNASAGAWVAKCAAAHGCGTFESRFSVRAGTGSGVHCEGMSFECSSGSSDFSRVLRSRVAEVAGRRLRASTSMGQLLLGLRAAGQLLRCADRVECEVATAGKSLEVSLGASKSFREHGAGSVADASGSDTVALVCFEASQRAPRSKFRLFLDAAAVCDARCRQGSGSGSVVDSVEWSIGEDRSVSVREAVGAAVKDGAGIGAMLRSVQQKVFS